MHPRCNAPDSRQPMASPAGRRLHRPIKTERIPPNPAPGGPPRAARPAAGRSTDPLRSGIRAPGHSLLSLSSRACPVCRYLYRAGRRGARGIEAEKTAGRPGISPPVRRWDFNESPAPGPGSACAEASRGTTAALRRHLTHLCETSIYRPHAHERTHPTGCRPAALHAHLRDG